MDYEKDYTFRRGDICWYEDPAPVKENTHILRGNHPVVVVSANRLNEVSTIVTVVPMTSNVLKKLYTNQVDITLNGQRSRIKCEQIRVVNKTDLRPPHASLNKAAMGALEDALMDALGIETDDCGTGRLATVAE